MSVQVLVSSTFSDLRSERDAVRAEIDALAREGMKIEWIGMEEFGSLAATPLDASTGYTAEADLVVLILGKRYGSRPPDDEMSFTEQEFNTALDERIPCLAYCAPGAKDADDESARAFQHRVSKEVTCEDFTSVDDLRRQVRRDLQREIGQVDTTSPRMFVRPPHPEVFVDRQAPLAQLRDAFAMETPRVALVAPAGMGKTALARRFLAGSELSDPDPVWLSIDELFGRSPSGRRLVRKAGQRCGYEALRRAIEKTLEDRPKRPIVFDNAQADPRAVRWLARKFTGPALAEGCDIR